jgi:hypothetical protein
MKRLMTMLLLLVCTLSLVAQKQDSLDVVYLKSGSVVRGQRVPIDSLSLKIRTTDSDFIFQISEVEKITREPARRRQRSGGVEAPTVLPTGAVSAQTILPTDGVPTAVGAKYVFGGAINPIGAPKEPFLAGILSFLIPGAGQFYNGDVLGGIIQMGTNVTLNTWRLSSNNKHVKNGPLLFAGLALNLWSCVEAARTAKNVNKFRYSPYGQFAYGGTRPRLQISPALLSADVHRPNNTLNVYYGLSGQFTF